MQTSVSAWWGIPLRTVIGYGFMAHGAAKLLRGAGVFSAVLHALGVPAPTAMAWITISIEVLGGAAVLAGAFIPAVAIPLAAVVIVTIFTVHLPYGFNSIKLVAVTAAGPQFGPPGYEVGLLYIAGLAALVLGGAGPLSIESARRRGHAPLDSELEVIPPGLRRDALLPLFLLADDSLAQIRSYYQAGSLFVLRGQDRAPCAIALVAPRGGDRSVELKSVAVAPEQQGRGLGLRLIALVMRHLRAAGVRRVVVGTASSSARVFAFYQKAGFRPLGVERDFFSESRGYRAGLAEGGIPLRDIVWLDREP
jgi:putative oxidoreductase